MAAIDIWKIARKKRAAALFFCVNFIKLPEQNQGVLFFRWPL